MRYSSTAVEIPKTNYRNQLQSPYLWGFFVSIPPYPTMLYVGRARRHFGPSATRRGGYQRPRPLRGRVAAATPPPPSRRRRWCPRAALLRPYAAAALRPPNPLRAAATPPRFRESGGRRRAARPRPHFLCSSPSLRSGRLPPAGLVACAAAGPPPLCRAASPLRPANVCLSACGSP